MKIIYTNNVTAVSANSEDANYPATNLQNDYTKDLWQAAAGINEAVVYVTVSSGAAVALFNTNATSATITAGIAGNYQWEAGYSWEADVSWESSETVTATFNLTGDGGSFWADYAEITTSHLITITLTAASGTDVNAGVVQAGAVNEFQDPRYGIDETSQDYSVELELNSGSEYYVKRDIARIMSNLQILETRANAFAFKHDIFDKAGPAPMAMRISTVIITEEEFIIFAKRLASPQIQHVSPDYSMISLAIKESI